MTIPETIETSARLNIGQAPTSRKSVTLPIVIRSTRFPAAPPSWRPRLVRTSQSLPACLRKKIRSTPIPTTEAISKNSVWFGKSPNALPVLLTCVILKKPVSGKDLPSIRLCLIQDFVD